MEKLTMEQMKPEQRINLIRASNAYLGRCLADPDHQERLRKYKEQLIARGRLPVGVTP